MTAQPTQKGKAAQANGFTFPCKVPHTTRTLWCNGRVKGQAEEGQPNERGNGCAATTIMKGKLCSKNSQIG